VESLTAARLAAISDDLILSAMGDDHRLVDVNPAWGAALGWKEGDLLGSRLGRFIGPKDRDQATAALTALGDGSTLTELRVDMLGDAGLVPVDWRFYRHEGQLYGVGRVLDGHAVESRVQHVLDRHEQKETDLEDESTEAKVALTKAQTWKTWLAAAVLVASSMVGALAWALAKIENSVRDAHQTEVRETKQDDELKALRQRADTDDKKFRAVGKALIRTEVQVSDSTEYVVDKIDAAHPRKAVASVREPPTVEAARTKVEAIKDAHRIDELFKFDEDAPDDPFAGIEEQP
jgi:hypothetical protein